MSLRNSNSFAPLRKIDESTGAGRWDFISIGDRSETDGGVKFTGHSLYASCEGEFTMNTLLFDVHSGVLIDPTGNGLKDTVNYVLRIPFPVSGWKTWLETDRLVGMKLLRYFNFCSRGYTLFDSGPNSQLRGFIVSNFLRLTKSGDMNQVIAVFFKRKIFRGPVEGHGERERGFLGTWSLTRCAKLRFTKVKKCRGITAT